MAPFKCHLTVRRRLATMECTPSGNLGLVLPLLKTVTQASWWLSFPSAALRAPKIHASLLFTPHVTLAQVPGAERDS